MDEQDKQARLAELRKKALKRVIAGMKHLKQPELWQLRTAFNQVDPPPTEMIVAIQDGHFVYAPRLLAKICHRYWKRYEDAKAWLIEFLRDEPRDKVDVLREGALRKFPENILNGAMKDLGWPPSAGRWSLPGKKKATTK